MMNNKPTSTQRVSNFRERQEALNRFPKQYYVTEEEHELLKRVLKECRSTTQTERG